MHESIYVPIVQSQVWCQLFLIPVPKLRVLSKRSDPLSSAGWRSATSAPPILTRMTAQTRRWHLSPASPLLPVLVPASPAVPPQVLCPVSPRVSESQFAQMFSTQKRRKAQGQALASSQRTFSTFFLSEFIKNSRLKVFKGLSWANVRSALAKTLYWLDVCKWWGGNSYYILFNKFRLKGKQIFWLLVHAAWRETNRNETERTATDRWRLESVSNSVFGSKLEEGSDLP